MSRHREFAALLAGRATLTPEEQTRLSLHLKQCASCRELAAEYDQQDAFLRALELPSPTPELRWGVLSRIDRPAAHRRSLSLRRWSRRAAGAALAPLVIAAVVAATVMHFQAQPAHAPFAAAPETSPNQKLTVLQAGQKQRAGASQDSAAPDVPSAGGSQYSAAGHSSLISSQTIAHGLKLSLSVPGDSYPKNALVQVTVRLQNASRHPVPIAVGSAFAPCQGTVPRAEITTASGRVLSPTPSARQVTTVCGSIAPGTLAPGHAIQQHDVVVLRDHYLRAVVSMPPACCPGMTTPALFIRFKR